MSPRSPPWRCHSDLKASLTAYLDSYLTKVASLRSFQGLLFRSAVSSP